MDFSTLKDEFAARGFDYLSDSRRGRYINLARAQLDAARLWPYRKIAVTGTASAGTVSADDLGTVVLVIDTTTSLPLTPANEEDLRRDFGDLTLAGSPFTYYKTSTGSAGTITAYPLGGTIRATYYKVTADLAGSTDTPVAPSQYHGLIVDLAVQMAYRDSDDHDAAERLQAWVTRQTVAMVSDLFADQTADAQTITFASADW